MIRYVSFERSIAGLHVVWRAKVIREIAVEHGREGTGVRGDCQPSQRASLIDDMVSMKCEP
jgi:hypothetical protein